MSNLLQIIKNPHSTFWQPSWTPSLIFMSPKYSCSQICSCQMYKLAKNTLFCSLQGQLMLKIIENPHSGSHLGHHLLYSRVKKLSCYQICSCQMYLLEKNTLFCSFWANYIIFKHFDYVVDLLDANLVFSNSSMMPRWHQLDS